MSLNEIAILVLMAIVALQAYFNYHLIQSSLLTMRRCSETTDKATALTMRAFDGVVDLANDTAPLSPQVTAGPTASSPAGSALSQRPRE